MIKSLKSFIALSTIAFSGSNIAFAEDMQKSEYHIDALSISDIYTARTHKSAHTAAIFMDVIHNGGEERRIVKASSPVSDRVELHTMIMDGDIMQMREAENGFVVAGHQDTDLNDMGAHFMLMGLKQQLKKGETVNLTVELDNGESKTFTVPVLDMAEVQDKQGGMH